MVKFITFEGCEGAGKTTQIKNLADYCEKNGISIRLTREPGGSPIAEAIRKIILDGKNSEMADCCEALLYAAARVQHLKDIVEPELQAGKLVVCDRYVDSSLAYQGYARGLGVDYVRSVNSYAFDYYMPACTLFLDISPKDAFLRKNGADKNDRIEQAGIKFHQKVYEGYLKIAEEEPDRFVKIDAHGSEKEVFARILTALRERKIIQ